jgi:hypothetical protein
MSLRQSRLPLVLAAAAILTAGNLACKKTGSAPTGYGVNVTIDSTMLSSAERASVTSVTFTVVDDTQPTLAPFKHTLDVVKQLQGGKVTFPYVPADSVANTDTLEIGVDALAGATLVGSGASGKVALKATAVEATIVLMGLGDGGVTPGADGGDGGSGKKTNGIACVTGDECNSTFCTDGVCCNEKCNDVCVSCNQSPTTKGTCTPYAANSDPEMECLGTSDTTNTGDAGTPTSEAGASEGGPAEGGASEAGATAGDASAADADQSDAETINTPDGGFMTTPATCAGTCGGARKCVFPGATTTCGKPFCNTRRDVGSFVCDGNGGCAPTLGSCKDYACDDSTGACRANCMAHVQCLTDDYCASDETCKGKKTNGIGCATSDECASGACSGGVCCNTACDGQGLTCTETGHVGQCQCMGVTCAAGVACQVFYQDADGDTYGNASGTILAGTAKAGCMGAAPPTGFVADNTDCDDGDANAHPGQTAFFPTASAGKHTFDYNCDGSLQKQTPEYPGGSCKFCSVPGSCATTSATCSAATSGSFQCPQEGIFTVPIGPIEPIETTTAATTIPTISPVITPASESAPELSSRLSIQPIRNGCCGCAASDKTGFLATVACGVTANTYTCTSCTAAGGGTSAGSPTAKTQSCH